MVWEGRSREVPPYPDSALYSVKPVGDYRQWTVLVLCRCDREFALFQKGEVTSRNEPGICPPGFIDTSVKVISPVTPKSLRSAPGLVGLGFPWMITVQTS